VTATARVAIAAAAIVGIGAIVGMGAIGAGTGPLHPAPARAGSATLDSTAVSHPPNASSPAPPPPDWLGAASRASEETGPSFALVAFDSAAGSWGVACAASQIACGARIPAAAAGAGAVASLGPGATRLHAALAALAAGADADSALAILRAEPGDPAARQAIAIARDGRAAAVSGTRLPGYSGARARPGFACAGFGLRGQETLAAMESVFFGTPGAGRHPRSTDAPLEEASSRELGARLLRGLEAAERAEGEPFEHRGMDASAALLVVRADADPGSGSDRLVDLRVDQGEDPVSALGRLYARDAETFLPAAHVRFGDAARRGGDDSTARREYAAAEAGFRAAVARAPKDGGALNELAWFLATRGGDPSEALRFAEAAVLARGDDPNILDTLAEAAYRAGNLERAIEAAERAARLARGNARYAERLRAFRAARTALAPSSR